MWADEMTPSLRYTVGDTAATPTYADDDLAQILLVAANQVQGEIRFAVRYAISVSNSTLTPDPSLAATRDDGFMILVVAKAAVVLSAAEIRLNMNNGLRIRDDKSEVVTVKDPKGLQVMAAAFVQQYEDAAYAYRTGGGKSLGRLVAGPSFPERRHFGFYGGGYGRSEGWF